MSGRWITNSDGDGITYEAPGGSTAHGDNITLEWPAVVRRESLEALFALTAQVEALTAQLAQAKAARRGATDLFKHACERAETLTAQRDEAVRLLRAMDDGEPCAPDHYLTCQAHSGGNPCEMDEARAFLRGVDQ
jgi:hypothetical protein